MSVVVITGCNGFIGRATPKALTKVGAWLEQHVLREEPFIKPGMSDFASDHFQHDISQRRKADPPAWYCENELELPRSQGDEARAMPGQQASV